MVSFRTVIGIFVVVASLGHGWAQSTKGCVAYEPTVLKLTGIVISKTYPGPPEYESIRKGDEPETYWLLALRQPLCVRQSDPTDWVNKTKTGIRQIQLVFFGDDPYKRYRRLLGKRVVATGTLYGSHTIHHKTPVLLKVITLEKAK